MRRLSTCACALALLACSSARGATAAPASPAAPVASEAPTSASTHTGAPGYEAEPELFSADVVGLRTAGRYTYVELSRDGERTWLVTVGAPAVEVGDRAVVAALGQADEFPSRRLGRTFEHLRFGVAANLDEHKELTWIVSL